MLFASVLLLDCPIGGYFLAAEDVFVEKTMNPRYFIANGLSAHIVNV